MLIHRCYIIWNSNKPMLFVLAFITFSINGIVTSIYSLNLYPDKCFSLEGISIGSIIAAIIAEHDTSKESNIRIMLISGKINDATLIATTVFNTVLTVLTGARIWWITLQARKVMGKAVDTQYKAIVAIVLESGLLYSLTLMIAIIVGDTLDPDGRGTVPVDLTMISTQMSGIAPTLIIVRAAYNKTAESVDQVVSTWQCAARTRQFESQMGSVLPSNVDSESGDEVDTSSEKV
ncbi:hypothetical protein V5O48_001137 [Marasmius crinis-equi]|uniref:Uncharacterized protein n=1 Tax=Marasmius crinis-equi TaxID=585013 RepID=A0ABR3FZ57_9AGAR